MTDFHYIIAVGEHHFIRSYLHLCRLQLLMRGSLDNIMGTVCSYCFVRVLNLALPLRGKNMKGGLGMVTKGRDSYKCIKCEQNVQAPHIIGDRGGTVVRVYRLSYPAHIVTLDLPKSIYST